MVITYTNFFWEKIGSKSLQSPLVFKLIKFLFFILYSRYSNLGNLPIISVLPSGGCVNERGQTGVCVHHK